MIISGRQEGDAAEEVGAQLGDDHACGSEVVQHVPVETVAKAIEAARESRAGVVVSIGGGSATGLAKAVARDTGLPILAVPTTYAGSEMTPIWGQSDQGEKTTGRDPRVLPSIVVYDPALTITMPQLTAASGMNALAHAGRSALRTRQHFGVVRRSPRKPSARWRMAYLVRSDTGRPEGPDRDAAGCLARWLGTWQHDHGSASQARACARRHIPTAARRCAQCVAATGGRVQCALSTGPV